MTWDNRPRGNKWKHSERSVQGQRDDTVNNQRVFNQAGPDIRPGCHGEFASWETEVRILWERGHKEMLSLPGRVVLSEVRRTQSWAWWHSWDLPTEMHQWQYKRWTWPPSGHSAFCSFSVSVWSPPCCFLLKPDMDERMEYPFISLSCTEPPGKASIHEAYPVTCNSLTGSQLWRCCYWFSMQRRAPTPPVSQ